MSIHALVPLLCAIMAHQNLNASSIWRHHISMDDLSGPTEWAPYQGHLQLAQGRFHLSQSQCCNLGGLQAQQPHPGCKGCMTSWCAMKLASLTGCQCAGLGKNVIITDSYGQKTLFKKRTCLVNCCSGGRKAVNRSMVTTMPYVRKHQWEYRLGNIFQWWSAIPMLKGLVLWARVMTASDVIRCRSWGPKELFSTSDGQCHEDDGSRRGWWTGHTERNWEVKICRQINSITSI